MQGGSSPSQPLLSELCSIWCVCAFYPPSCSRRQRCCECRGGNCGFEQELCRRKCAASPRTLWSHTSPRANPRVPPSNNNKPNYRCPRCATRTCSLSCYRRHQQWAQCSGKRDPTAYVKRGQLATPAGLDHDYNFLTGIERAFDRADHDAEDRGIRVRSDKAKAPARGSNYEKHLESTRVVVERAPAGMSRQKQNNTRWNTK